MSTQELDIERALKVLKDARASLDRNPDDPGLAVEYIKYLPELKAAELDQLSWLLASGQYGCSRNDVLGLFEHFRNWLEANKEAI